MVVIHDVKRYTRCIIRVALRRNCGCQAQRLSIESLSVWYVEWMSETLQTVRAVASKSRILCHFFLLAFSSIGPLSVWILMLVSGGCNKAEQKLNTPTHKYLSRQNFETNTSPPVCVLMILGLLVQLPLVQYSATVVDIPIVWASVKLYQFLNTYDSAPHWVYDTCYTHLQWITMASITFDLNMLKMCWLLRIPGFFATNLTTKFCHSLNLQLTFIGDEKEVSTVTPPVRCGPIVVQLTCWVCSKL